MEPSHEAGGTAVLVLAGLPEALAAAGLRAWPVQSRVELARHLAAAGGRCAAVLDATRPAPYSFAACYQLLHQLPPVPTLVVLPPEGAPPLGSGAVPPLDDFIRLPAQPAEIVLRVPALLLRGGLAIPPTPVTTMISAEPSAAVLPAATLPAERDVNDGEHPTNEPVYRPALAPAASELPPGVRLYAGTHLFVGQVDPGRRRLSDHLNDVARGYLETAEATWHDLLAESETGVPAGVVTLRKDELQIVVPGPEPPARSSTRVLTQPVPVQLVLPLFLVSGNMHRRTGDPTHLLQWFLETGRLFVPLAGATIRFLPNSRFDLAAQLVLVNLRQVHGWWSPPA